MSRTQSHLELQAAAFAVWAHTGQQRKYTGEPYTVHLDEVANIVASVPHTEAMLAAARLHDTIEDTPVTKDMIEREFGAEVTRLVVELTDVTTLADGNRRERKAIETARLAGISDQGQTIKLADLISNTRSIMAHDRDFATVYLKEKAALLQVLTRGDRQLWITARDLVVAGLQELQFEVPEFLIDAPGDPRRKLTA